MLRGHFFPPYPFTLEHKTAPIALLILYPPLDSSPLFLSLLLSAISPHFTLIHYPLLAILNPTYGKRQAVLCKGFYRPDLPAPIATTAAATAGTGFQHALLNRRVLDGLCQSHKR